MCALGGEGEVCGIALTYLHVLFSEMEAVSTSDCREGRGGGQREGRGMEEGERKGEWD